MPDNVTWFDTSRGANHFTRKILARETIGGNTYFLVVFDTHLNDTNHRRLVKHWASGYETSYAHDGNIVPEMTHILNIIQFHQERWRRNEDIFQAHIAKQKWYDAEEVKKYILDSYPRKFIEPIVDLYASTLMLNANYATHLNDYLFECLLSEDGSQYLQPSLIRR